MLLVGFSVRYSEEAVGCYANMSSFIRRILLSDYAVSRCLHVQQNLIVVDRCGADRNGAVSTLKVIRICLSLHNTHTHARTHAQRKLSHLACFVFVSVFDAAVSPKSLRAIADGGRKE